MATSWSFVTRNPPPGAMWRKDSSLPRRDFLDAFRGSTNSWIALLLIADERPKKRPDESGRRREESLRHLLESQACAWTDGPRDGRGYTTRSATSPITRIVAQSHGNQSPHRVYIVRCEM